MTQYATNGIGLEAEAFGDPGNPCILLVMGLGMQLTAWHETFCRMLVEQGFYVIRFDNRDAGLSTDFESHGRPVLPVAFFKKFIGLTPRSHYTLEDMADDSIGLLNAMGIAKAHVVGASMGGMIAQVLAIKYPERLLSVTSIMSTTGARNLPMPSARARRVLMRPPNKAATPNTERGMKLLVDQYVDTFSVIGSQKYLPDTPAEVESFRSRLADNIRRSYRPWGVARQMAAILASPDRTKALRKVKLPALVIHGLDDPLVPLACGQATANAIPGARMEIIGDMGHDLPEPLWPRITGLIAAHAMANNPAARQASNGPASASNVTPKPGDDSATITTFNAVTAADGAAKAA